MSNTKNTSGKNSDRSSATNDYKYIPRAENPSSKATTDKRPSSGNIKGV